MASDRSPPQKSHLHHVRPDSSSNNTTPSAGNRRMPTPGQSSRRGSADSSTLLESANVNDSLPPQLMTGSASPFEATATEPPSTSATPAPYGTRSRGRNAPRPNYAEDRDLDVDLEVQQPHAKSTKRSSAAPTSNGAPRIDGEKSNSRKSTTAANGSNSTAAAKDGIPGTSSFLAKPDEVSSSSGSSRKRKQPASATTPTFGTENASKKLFTSAPGANSGGDSNMVTFDDRGAYLKNGKITADDGTTFAVNEHVYLICEPPGEPYYLARIMEFLPNKTSGPIEAIRVNWYYRPRDIQRNAADTRLVFASMHSDTCPLTSLRGKCQIKHSSEIANLDEYRKTRDCFWYDKMFDRYIHRYYDVIPTSKVINVPANVKKVLDERWRYVLVEVGKRKELTSAVKTCKRCGLYAANTDSVDCAVCHNTYHMHCVKPVLTKKPARGFAWACAACSRAQERKLEARNTPMLGEATSDAPEVDEEMVEEEEEDPNAAPNGTTVSTPAPIEEEAVRPATQEQIAQAKLWPYRYLGIHCRVEDALDYDDRIYPRASSRLGPRHQAVVNQWPGRPIEYVKPIDIKKKYLKGSGGRRDSRLTKETVAALEAAKKERANRPIWVMEEPPGFMRRGEDEPVPVTGLAGKQVRTAELLFKMPTAEQMPARGEDDGPRFTPEDREKFIDEYMERAKQIAPEVGVEKHSTDFLDKALELLYAQSFDVEAALAKLKRINKHDDLDVPRLRPDEVKAFEQAVAKYGSEWRNITKHVGTVPHFQIVRYYYMWKKTPRGRQIWGSYGGRKGKKEARRSSSAKLVDDVADDHDDSAFDNDKAMEKKRGFQCKFCSTRSSRQWRRAPGVTPGTTVPAEPTGRQRDKGPQLTLALCLRCALLWRKYGIQWENVEEVAKKIGQSGNKSWRRRVDEELLTQLLVEDPTVTADAAPAAAATPTNTLQQDSKKRNRNEKESTATSTATSVEPVAKKKNTNAEQPPPIEPEPPVAKTLPCAICDKIEPMGDDYLSCRDCRLTVHRNCYGVSPSRNCVKWLCDTCSNDRSPLISTTYECVLCPVTWTEHELMEAPKSTTHKKKTDRDREKERLERGLVADAIKLYRERQEAVGKPIGPREPLKRTAGNNWIHVGCAIWTPEIKFGNAKELEPAEGFGLIPAERFRETCKICKSNKGACVPCHFSGCNAHFHVGCAFQARYKTGFDITPVKSSRRDTTPSVRLGDEVGAATPAIWCPHHSVSGVIHETGQLTEDGLNAIQLYARTYKQADLSITGTVRRAAYNQTPATNQTGNSTVNRRTSTVNGTTTLPVMTKDKPAASEDAADEMQVDSDTRHQASSDDRKCATCSTAYTPKWWPIDNARRPTTAGQTFHGNGSSASPPFPYRHPQSSVPALNGDHGSEDSKSLFDCHKCHLKKSKAQPSPEPRRSPYQTPRPALPTARLSDYHSHPYGSPHSHPTQQPPPTGLSRPVGLSAASSPERYPGYERPGDYGESKLRNGIHGAGYRSSQPPPPTIRQLNGYQPPPALGAQSHYSTGAHPPPPPPGPQAYAAHQSPYGPVSLSSPHPPTAPGPRPYASASPPDVPATMVRHHSPPHSLSALNGGPPPPRVFSADRVLSASTRSPPVSQAHVDPRGRTPPNKLDDNTIAGAMSLSSGRHTATLNGANSGSGASASPSLKNLLS
ncbi:hypothetical protein BJX68DRAFT_52133 [Aspergillus pseudodeflectus]|uniref:PHD finger and BAH domain protein n=1 Tax=Aspergillus pseudodeflectus TaxID=176178 RepID=A0ABR4KLI4_9EURO